MIARVFGVIGLAVIAVAALDRGVVEPLRCSHAASTGSILLDSISGAPDDRRLAAAALVRASLRHCENISPPDVGIPFTLGAAEEMSGDYRAAIDAYERALRIDRRPEIYFRLGVAQLDALDRTAGVASLTRACTFDPRLLAEIPYEDVRREVEGRIRTQHGAAW